MPKVSTETTEAPKRAPRKRAVRRVVTKSDAPVRRTRAVSSVSRETSQSAPVRRAPVRVVSTEPKSNKKLYVVLTTIVFIAGAATWIGVSDAGQIDVNARITEMNEREAAAPNSGTENEPQSVVVPVQNTPPVVPVSNLRGRGVGTPSVVQPAPEVVPEAATTTEATSTEETVVSSQEATSEESQVTESSTE